MTDVWTNRSQLDIITDILSLTKEQGLGITQLTKKANLNFTHCKEYTEMLVEKNLLRTVTTEEGRRFQTTRKGCEFLDDCVKMLQWLTLEETPHKTKQTYLP